MDAIQRLQPLDFVLAIVWAAIVGYGASTGAIRQLILLVATYLGAIVAGQAYKPAGEALANFGFGRGAVPQTQWVAYVLLFFATLLGVGLLTRRAYPHTRLGRQRRSEHVAGALIAAVWGLLVLIEVIAILRFFTSTFWPGQEAMQIAIAGQLERSQLVPTLQAGLAPLWQVMQPWFPEPLKPARA